MESNESSINHEKSLKLLLHQIFIPYAVCLELNDTCQKHCNRIGMKNMRDEILKGKGNQTVYHLFILSLPVAGTVVYGLQKVKQQHLLHLANEVIGIC